MPLYTKRPSPLTSRVARPIGQAVPFQFKASAVPKMSLKPGPTSITSKFVGAPMQNPTISGAGSSGSMGNVLGNAATGALIGGAAKIGYDYLTKKPTVAPRTGTSVPPTSVIKKAATTATAKPTPVKPQTPVKPTPIPPVKNTEESPTQPPEEPPVEEPPVEEVPAEEPVVEEPPVDEVTWDDSSSEWRKGGFITMMRRGGLAYMAEGGLPENAVEVDGYPGAYMITDDAGEVSYVDSSGDPIEDISVYAQDTTDNTEGPVGPGQPETVISDDGSTATMNPDGSVTSTPMPQDPGSSDFLSPDLMKSIKGALPAAGAGALLAALLGSDFGSSGRQNQGVDMSKLSTLNPRTTDFGIGPARFVNYDEYGSQDQMPDIYGQQLYGDLGTPGAAETTMPIEEYGQFPTDFGNADRVEAFADGGNVDGYYSYGTPVDPLENMRVQAMKQGGLPAYSKVPVAGGRLDFRQGSAVHGPGDGQSDDIPAMLADGEYVFDADTVAALGNGSTKAGALALDKMREQIRKHKRSAPVHKIPPPAKSPLAYLKGSK